MTPQHYTEVRPLRKGPRNQLNAVLGVVGVLAGCTPGWLSLYWRAGLVAAGILFILPIALSVRTVVSSGSVEVAIRPFRRWSFPVENLRDMEVVASDHLVSLFGGRNTRASRFGTIGEGNRDVGNQSVKFTLSSGEVHQVGSFHPHALIAAVEAQRGAASGS